MIEATEIRKGMKIKVGDQLYSVIFAQHHKPGKGGAMMRTKIKNLLTGSVTERTFRGGDKIEQVSLDKEKYQYLYKDTSGYHFMNTVTYEQISFSEERLGTAVGFMKENMEVSVFSYNGQVIGVDFPKNVVLKVTYTEPGHRGDTATNVMKASTLETGIKVQVPLFINTGDDIVVDIETGKYIERK